MVSSWRLRLGRELRRLRRDPDEEIMVSSSWLRLGIELRRLRRDPDLLRPRPLFGRYDPIEEGPGTRVRRRPKSALLLRIVRVQHQAFAVRPTIRVERTTG